jgi:predicted aminopeptidase
MIDFDKFPPLAKQIGCGFIILLMNGCYYLKQGSELLSYQCSAESNKTIIADTATPPEVTHFLRKVEDIRAFAVEKIGLNKTNNFSCFVKTERDYLIDNVYAAQADTFAQYFWHYPFFGAMPYKGFFNRHDAEKEAARLQKRGYDVLIGEVDGFSSLGILRDPVYSFMANYGPFSLANLIFHELTHATIYRKNQSQFNEEAATFIGTEAALSYVAETFGKNSEAYKKALLLITDNATYHRLIDTLYAALDSVYRTVVPANGRIAAKLDLIDRFKKNIAANYDAFFKTRGYASINRTTINNASILIQMTYTRDLSMYRELYKRCGNDLKKTVAALKEINAMKGDPKENLRARLLQ